jgi:hypothetical protein
MKCVHSADPGLCGYRSCHHYGKETPPNRYAGRRHVIAKLGRNQMRRARVEGRHPSFVDMTDWSGAGWTVLSAAPGADDGAQWNAQHSCGAVSVVRGARLRNKPPKYCPSCRPAKLVAA